jgi:ribosomal protein S27AE
MIRVFAKLCKTLLEKLTDVEIFKQAADGFDRYNESCPSCGAFGKLSPCGSYSRNVVSYEDGTVVDSRVSPHRFECASCGATHALLPDILIPNSSYSFRFKLFALIAYFDRDTTVSAVCERFGIAVSTLYSWKKLLLEHKELLLGIVASQKESAIAFIQSLFWSPKLSSRICGFFRRHAFSFMQRTPAAATRSPPP